MKPLNELLGIINAIETSTKRIRDAVDPSEGEVDLAIVQLADSVSLLATIVGQIVQQQAGTSAAVDALLHGGDA